MMLLLESALMLASVLVLMLASVNTVSSVIRLSPPLSWWWQEVEIGSLSRILVLMENGVVCLFTLVVDVVWMFFFTLVVGVVWMFFYLGGWCRVDVVEESLEIVAGKRTVHLLVRPCIGFR